MRDRRGWAATLFAVIAILDWSGPRAGEAEGKDPEVFGRVRILEVPNLSATRAEAIRGLLEARFRPGPGGLYAERRVIAVSARDGEPLRFDATIYDYAVEKAFELLVDENANELARREIALAPTTTESELEDARAIVSASPLFSGLVELYAPMPPSTSDARGRRLVNVGVLSHPSAGAELGTNEVVSVHIPTQEIVRYASRAPESSRANATTCGPPIQGCGAVPGDCISSYYVEWPAESPVWKFTVTHPKCTTDVQPDATGLLLTEVYYKDELILERAEMPVLNVQYHGNTCGPYRDWLWQEDCFEATGVDVGDGIRVTTGNPAPTTLCESGSDFGNFKGVAIHDQGSYLWLVTESRAGWYRYVMEWKLYLDGTIEPVFGFGAARNSCTCNLHVHHAYWRFEWAIGGASGNQSTGINTVERLVHGSADLYSPIASEGKFTRPTPDFSSDRWRIQNAASGTAYILEPGYGDGDAVNDPYADADTWALAYNPNEINDPSGGGTAISINSWVNGEPLGAGKRLVLWYHASYEHDTPAGADEACELVGPRLVPYKMCSGNLGLDRSTYGCNSMVNVTLEDSDLAGAGTRTVAVSSAAEAVPETVTLIESPPGTGRFSGLLPTTAAPSTNGDGKISVADGDSVSVRYLDASACGVADVTIEKTASIDCAAPVISGIAATNVRGASAVITWLTSEPAGSTVHYGPETPDDLTASSPLVVSAHDVLLDGLAECTRYDYWVESTDPQGNMTRSDASGGYFSFTTGKNVAPAFTSHDTPLTIPDHHSAGVVSTVSVPDGAIVEDVNVTANITHSYDEDLVLTLTTPTGDTVTLSDARGGAGDNYTDTTFDDQATIPIASGDAPFSGAFTPETPLSVANGIVAAGLWKLTAVDQEFADVGSIDSWTLGLTYPADVCSAQSVPPPTPDGTFGSAMTASRLDLAGSSVALTWDVATCVAPNYHLLFGPLASVSSYVVDGAACGLGTAGAYTWSGVPAGDLWFVIVADNGGSIESSWGKASDGTERAGTTPSGFCGCTTRDNSGTCP